MEYKHRDEIARSKSWLKKQYLKKNYDIVRLHVVKHGRYTHEDEILRLRRCF